MSFYSAIISGKYIKDENTYLRKIILDDGEKWRSQVGSNSENGNDLWQDTEKSISVADKDVHLIILKSNFPKTKTERERERVIERQKCLVLREDSI